MTYPLVRELAVDGIPVAVTRRVLKLARQPYYRWLAAPVGRRDLHRAYLANAVFDAYADDPSTATGSSPTKPARPARQGVTGRCGGSAATSSGGAGLARDAARTGRSPARPPTTTGCGATSQPVGRTRCG